MATAFKEGKENVKPRDGNGPGYPRSPQPSEGPVRLGPEPLALVGARRAVHAIMEDIGSTSFDRRLACGVQMARGALARFVPVLADVEALAQSSETCDRELAKTALAGFSGKVQQAVEWYPGLRTELAPSMRTVQKVLVALGELDLGTARESVSCAVQRMDNCTFDSMLETGTEGVGPVFSGFTAALPMLDMLVHSDREDDWQVARKALRMFCDKAGKAHMWWPLRQLVPKGSVDQMEHRLAVLGQES